MPPTTRRASRPFLFMLALSVALLFYVIWPFRTPLFLGVVLAAVLHGSLEQLVRTLHGRRKLASGVVTLTVLLVLVAPLASLIAFATQESVVGLDYLRDTLGVHSVDQLRGGTLPWPLLRLVNRALEFLHLSREQLYGAFGKGAQVAQDAFPALLASGGWAVFSTVIMLVTLYFMLLDGARIMGWLSRISPIGAALTEELTGELRRVTRATVVGILATAIFQGLAAGVGYGIAGIPHAGFFGMLTSLVSFVPGIGTALVWVPAVASLWLGARRTAAVLLAIFCLVVVVGAEQVGKPLLMRGQVDMHAGLIFLALLGGLAMFGLLGIVLGPLVVAFFLAMMRIYERDFRYTSAPAGNAKSP